jgi:hypothetical protein
MRRGAGKDKYLKRYLTLARRSIRKVSDHALDFDLKWLADLTGVIAWVELNQTITPDQKRAIRNASQAVDNMVKYKRWKERRKAKRKEVSDGPSETAAEGNGEAR